ncbi:MAG: hypothetical protein IJ675_07790, partial [Pseudobutyrivibrio sp.]|nr:hypothetical protein [Pseudobutyrivibrio sp.]
SEWVEPSKDEVDNIELPLSYDKLKDSYSFYYHGNSISDYELVQTAVASGKLQLPEAGETADPQIAYKAFKALVMDEAAPKYPWSDTLYSEDGKYTFTRDSRGNLKFNLIEDEDMGVAVEDIANWIMSGTPNRNIETRYINYLRKIDPDLLEKAQTIGEEVRTNGFLEDLHEQGIISDKQSIYDMGLLGMLFGKNSDDMKLSLNNCKKSNDYLSLLVDFNKEGANSLKNLRLKQLKESNGGIY